MRVSNVAKSGWLNIACQVVLFILLYAFARSVSIGSDGVLRLVVLLILVLVPSVLWTAFFYLQDRIEPEPSRYVIAAFLSGMAVASVFALPIEAHLFTLGAWMHESLWRLFLGATLVRGTLASFLLYAVIRYWFYPSREFDEPVDGMVYGAFIGSGFATVTSLGYLTGHPEFTLFAIGYTAAVNILVYASTGAVVGHLVGRTKFTPASVPLWHTLAFVVGALLIGLYHTANELVFLAGLEHALWASFGLTVFFAAGVLFLVTLTMRRLTQRDLHQSVQAVGRLELPVLACFVLLLLAGGLAERMATRPVRFASERYGIAFQYPPARLKPTIAPSRSADGLPLLPPLFNASGQGQGPFAVSVRAKRESIDLSAVDPLAYLAKAEPLSIVTENTEVAGRKGIRVTYAYIRKRDAAGGELPEILWSVTDIVPSKRFTYTFTFEAPPGAFEQHQRVYQGILSSVRWTGD